MIKPGTGQPRGRTGFTLLEIMVALTIFAVCITALYNSFRIASRSFEHGRLNAEVMQNLRFCVDTITRDLRSIHYKPDANKRFDNLEMAIWKSQDRIVEAFEGGDVPNIPGVPKSPEEAETIEDTFVGLMADLRFHGKGGDEDGFIEFARYLPSDGTLDNSYLGTERVRYFVHDHNLYRQRSRVFRVMHLNPNLGEELVRAREQTERMKEEAMEDNRPYMDLYAMRHLGVMPDGIEDQLDLECFIPADPEPGPAELIARGVKTFKLEFGRYDNGSWSEANTWDSASKQHRTPEFKLDMNDPLFMKKLQMYQRREADHLPAYVKLTLTIDPRMENKDDKKKKKKKKGVAKTVTTKIWVPASRETFNPMEEDLFEPTPTDKDGNPILGGNGTRLL